MAKFSRVMDCVDLQGGQRNNAYIYRDPQKGGKWHLYFLNQETNKNHRFVLKRSDGGYPDPSAAGENEALGSKVVLPLIPDQFLEDLWMRSGLLMDPLVFLIQ